MKKLTMAIVTMIMVMIMALSANAEGTEFVGCKIRTTHATSASNGINTIMVAEDNIFTILSEDNGQFAIEVNGENYWIDSNEVFINVKDYIPSIEVNLVMADKAIFQMAGEGIHGLGAKSSITDLVLKMELKHGLQLQLPRNWQKHKKFS